MAGKHQIIYVTSSAFKQQENAAFVRTARLSNGVAVADAFEFHIKPVPIKEILEVNLEVMVQEEVVKAYSQLRVPCIVEHAGLIFEEYKDKSYPGGLTKPMWDTLGEHFVAETKSAGRRAIARAVVAYCDGSSVSTFVGETCGTLANEPRGNRKFYWDTVFMPDDPSGKANGKTYAEIVDDHSLGIDFKMGVLSQSSRAMLKFLEHVRSVGPAPMWR